MLQRLPEFVLLCIFNSSLCSLPPPCGGVSLATWYSHCSSQFSEVIDSEEVDEISSSWLTGTRSELSKSVKPAHSFCRKLEKGASWKNVLKQAWINRVVSKVWETAKKWRFSNLMVTGCILQSISSQFFLHKLVFISSLKLVLSIA